MILRLYNTKDEPERVRLCREYEFFQAAHRVVMSAGIFREGACHFNTVDASRQHVVRGFFAVLKLNRFRVNDFSLCHGSTPPSISSICTKDCPRLWMGSEGYLAANVPFVRFLSLEFRIFLHGRQFIRPKNRTPHQTPIFGVCAVRGCFGVIVSGLEYKGL